MSKYIKTVIKYFFSHDVSEELQNKVQQRIADTDDVDMKEEALKEIWDNTENKEMPEMHIDTVYEDVRTSLFGEKNHAHSYQWLRIAALWVLPVMFLSFSGLFYYSAQKRGKEIASLSFVHKFMAYGERGLVVLPDSSKVWLNGGSLLIYPSNFITGERSVTLSGEAFFDVKKDPAHPFSVNINRAKLSVLGTTFNVSAYPENTEVSATLKAGKISVCIDGHNQSYILTPNDHLVYNSVTDQVQIGKVNVDNYLGWLSGSLYFNDTPFSEVVTQLERTYHVRIHVANTQYMDQRIRAHFSSDDTIEEVMDIMKLLIPNMRYEIHGTDLYIR